MIASQSLEQQPLAGTSVMISRSEDWLTITIAAIGSVSYSTLMSILSSLCV